jgi:hypothetical protein
MLSQEIEKAAMSKMRIPAGLRGWTYPNTADKGSSMAPVNNYWHKLKSAIGGVEAADKKQVIAHL